MTAKMQARVQRRWFLRLLLPLAGALSCGSRAAAPPPAPVLTPEVQPPPISCRPEPGSLLIAEPGADVHCVIDVGSRNVKLVVASARPGEPRSLQNLRQCRSRMQLADKTRDPVTHLDRALSIEDQRVLLALFRAYRGICQADGGRMHPAVATEWARQATNIDEVRASIQQRTAVPIHVLTRKQEARTAYLAATRGQRGKLVLDFGSRSLQLAFWASDAAEPEVRSVPMGIDEVGDRFFAKATSYEAGRKAMIEAMRLSLGPMLIMVRRAARRGTLSGELYSLGENGDLALATLGQLWRGRPARAIDEASYTAAVKLLPRPDPAVGVDLPFAGLRAMRATLAEQPLLFEDLRERERRRVFGNKMLVFPALMSWLKQEAGLNRLVLLPQEMADGVLVAALTPIVPRN
jgi:hypothetical protein